ncbi:metallophosphoesterase family protein [Aquabacterium humicola]|uniref:metallophosphoesterase family protein n=1 Tax=Aquabacterium humicola TaxID=3237377 RepID=UPI002543E65E|nr:metallophosphoesterase family protein [Rubrivivax pictus]
MKLALLSDVHANLVALDAVLDELRREGITQLVCLGDMIQGGVQPAQTVQRLRELGCPIVMGNADAWLLSGRMTGTEDFEDERLAALDAARQWTLDQLDAQDRAFIGAFRPTVEIALGGTHRLLACHGSPTDFDQFLLPTTPEEEFQRHLAPWADAIVAGGHMHLQFIRRLRDGFFFNPGSVGVAYRHAQAGPEIRLDPWAEYAVLRLHEGRPALEFRRVPFDVEALRAAWRRSDRPGAERALAQYDASL